MDQLAVFGETGGRSYTGRCNAQAWHKSGAIPASEVVSVSPRRDLRPTGSWVPMSPFRPFAVSQSRRFAICYFLSAILLFPSMARYLTGIQPSGILHIGNYFGDLRPAVVLQVQGEEFYVYADFQAMTTWI